MKKVFALLVCLCMMVSVALAEDVPELNWAEIGTEEVQAQGEFWQIDTTVFWIPSVMASVDVSGMEGFFKPAALYGTEDGAYAVTLFVSEAEGLEQYAALMEKEGGGSNFRNLIVNGVECIGYEVESANMECLLYPVTENKILTFSFVPMDGDDDWDGTKAAIIASIQPAAE